MATCTVVETATKTRRQPKRPAKYAAVFINDDKTPMELVVVILMDVFGKNQADAVEITERVHTSGRAPAGLFSKEIAEQKSSDAMNIAREHGYPLEVIAEKA